MCAADAAAAATAAVAVIVQAAASTAAAMTMPVVLVMAVTVTMSVTVLLQAGVASVRIQAQQQLICTIDKIVVAIAISGVRGALQLRQWRLCRMHGTQAEAVKKQLLCCLLLGAYLVARAGRVATSIMCAMTISVAVVIITVITAVWYIQRRIAAAILQRLEIRQAANAADAYAADILYCHFWLLCGILLLMRSI